MNLKLKGKVALITGASKGIGYSIAEALKREGCLLAINSRSIKNLSKAKGKLGKSIGIQGDVTEEKEARKIVETTIKIFGKLDIVICNVGSGLSVPPGRESSSDWIKMFSVNFLSATNIIEASQTHLRKRGGVVLCISSICGQEVIPNAPITYSIAKAALNAYIKAMSRPFGKLNIRINGIAPGNIMFPGSTWNLKMKKDAKKVNNFISEEVPLQRFGKPENVADLAAWLCSTRASFVTGKIYEIDGGQARS